MPTTKKATKKKAAAQKTTDVYETIPAKKLSLDKLERLQGSGINKSHNRFVVDRKNKIAWAPAWVKDVKTMKK